MEEEDDNKKEDRRNEGGRGKEKELSGMKVEEERIGRR